MKKQDLSVLKSIILREMEGGMCNECGGAMYEGMCTECGWMEEALHGGQKNLDVAPPFGKLTGDDFDALRDKKGMKNEAVSGKLEVTVYNRAAKKIVSKTLVGANEQVSVVEIPSGVIVYNSEEGLRENHEGQDHEVSMANNSLDSIEWAVGELKRQLGGQERDIPAWIQDHITNAENYILQAAKNFHDYGHEEQGEAPETEYGDEEAQDMSLSSLMEAKKKPSAGLSKKQKSAIAKKARKGGDIGKKGRGFEKVEKAAKKSGADNPKAVAAAAMWKAAAKRAKK